MVRGQHMKFIHKPNNQLIEVSKQISDKKSYMSVTKLTGKESEQDILDWRKKSWR